MSHRMALLCALLLFSPSAVSAGTPQIGPIPVIIGGPIAGVHDGFNVWECPPGAVVTLNFQGSAGIQLCTDQPSGISINCSQRTAMKIADGTGRASFHLQFGGYNNGNVVGVLVDNEMLQLVPARSTDINADGITGLSDFSIFASGYQSGHYLPQLDFDDDRTIGLVDFSRFAGDYFVGAGFDPQELCP